MIDVIQSMINFVIYNIILASPKQDQSNGFNILKLIQIHETIEFKTLAQSLQIESLIFHINKDLVKEIYQGIIAIWES